MKTESEVIKAIKALPPIAKGEKKIQLVKAYLDIRGELVEQWWAYTDKFKRKGRQVFQVAQREEKHGLFVRNLYFSPYGGWFVAFPGDVCHSYLSGMPGTKHEVWRYVEVKKGAFNPAAKDLENPNSVIANMEGLKYFKAGCGKPLTEQIAVYREYPQSESLFKLGLDKLACQKHIYHLSRPLTKALCKYIYKNAESIRGNQNLNWVMGAYSSGLCFSDYLERKKDAMDMRRAYFKEQNIDEHQYADYVAMARAQGYDMNDAKWRFPRDFLAMHGSLCKVRDKELADAINAAIAEHTEKMRSLEKTCDGYAFRFPTSYQDFKEQAEALGNCLISNGYFKRYADGDACIVFVVKDGKRVGTAQINEANGNTVQFTANQKVSWRPDADMQSAYDAWKHDTFMPWVQQNRAPVCWRAAL